MANIEGEDSNSGLHKLNVRASLDYLRIQGGQTELKLIKETSDRLNDLRSKVDSSFTQYLFPLPDMRFEISGGRYAGWHERYYYLTQSQVQANPLFKKRFLTPVVSDDQKHWIIFVNPSKQPKEDTVLKAQIVEVEYFIGLVERGMQPEEAGRKALARANDYPREVARN